jgi:hypothetical protein
VSKYKFQSTPFRLTQFFQIVILLGATSFCGCGSEEPIARHQIPKKRSGLDGIRTAKPLAQQQGPVSSDLLEGWQSGATNAMVPIRINRTFDDEKAEITVIPLPAAANDWDSNVNRWASSQLGLILDAEALSKITSEVSVDGKVGRRVRLVDESATDGKAIIGLMVVEKETAWFIKLMGSVSAVEQAESDFDRFVSEFKFPGGNEKATRQPIAPIANINPDPAVDLPEGWRLGATNSMVPIRINKTFNDEKAEITVIPLPAAANEWDANVNRWAASQLGLKLDKESLSKITSEVTVDGQTGQRVRLVDETATDGKAIIGLMIVKDETAWFLKLMGSMSAVEKAESEFDDFVEKFKFPS